MTPPLVTLITPNLNGRCHLEALLDSVREQGVPADQLEVIVVDNGSTDGSTELVRDRFPWARVLRNEENVGFARANNQGAREAAGKYLALVNNDIRLDRAWLRTMLAARQAETAETACVASRILSWNGSTIDFVGGTMAFNGVGFNTDFGAPAIAPRTYPGELLFASGAAMLVDRDVFLEVGGFDDDYFAYYEDVDFGWRLWLLGFRVVFCPEAVAYHRRNASLPGREKTVFLLERNALYSMVKNYEDATLAAFLPAALLLAAHRAAARASHGGDQRPARTRPRRPWKRTEGAVREVPDGEGGATVAALDAVVQHLPKLMEKRRAVQAARRRPDDEIGRLFGTPLGPWQDGTGVEFELLRALGVPEYFESALTRPPATAP
jgi:GT2 family glycosyltransferase